MSEKILFVDLETTGLDVGTCEIFEIAIIEENGKEWCWSIEPSQYALDLMNSETARLTRYYERTTHPDWVWSARKDTRKELEVARQVSALLDGAHVIGICPNFDLVFLAAWLQRSQINWYYQPIDVEVLAAGFMIGRGIPITLPLDSNQLERVLGVAPPEKHELHTALGDARWNKRIWDKLWNFLLSEGSRVEL
jgi:oligoribonuclease (3'-5' exoribonuclease)